MSIDRDLKHLITEVVAAANVRREDHTTVDGVTGSVVEPSFDDLVTVGLPRIVLYVGRTVREATKHGIQWKCIIGVDVQAETSEVGHAVERQLRAHSGAGKGWVKWYHHGETAPSGTVCVPLGLDATADPATTSEAAAQLLGVAMNGVEMLLGLNQDMVGRVIEMTELAATSTAERDIARFERDTTQTNDLEVAMPLLRDMARIMGGGAVNAPDDPAERAAFAVGQMEVAAQTLASAIQAGAPLTPALKQRLAALVEAAAHAATA